MIQTILPGDPVFHFNTARFSSFSRWIANGIAQIHLSLQVHWWGCGKPYRDVCCATTRSLDLKNSWGWIWCGHVSKIGVSVGENLGPRWVFQKKMRSILLATAMVSLVQKSNEFHLMLQDATGSSCFVEVKVGEHLGIGSSPKTLEFRLVCVLGLFGRCIRTTGAVTTSRRELYNGSVRWEIPLETHFRQSDHKPWLRCSFGSASARMVATTLWMIITKATNGWSPLAKVVYAQPHPVVFRIG